MAHVKKVKASELLSIDTCHRKGYFERLGLGYAKGKSYQMSIRLKELFKTIDFAHATFATIEAELLKLMDDSFFVSKRAKEEEVQLLCDLLMRYVTFEQEKDRTILQRGAMNDVEINGFSMTATADFIFENENYVEVVKVKKGAPMLSYSGKKFETRPENSLDLYLLFLLGKKLYGDKPILASLYHLKSKDDKRNELAPAFEVRKGKNMISYSFKEEEQTVLDERIEKLLTMDLSMESEKTCNTSECENCVFANICNYEIAQEPIVVEEQPRKAGDLKLTKSQYEAIFFRKGIARINAGAGSGKTTVLALRVSELIQEGVLPKEILLITFTNKGAEEIREKIAFWLTEMDLDADLVKQMHITTFNGWGDSLIHREFEKLGFTQPPMLAEKVHRYDIIFEILDENDRVEGFDYRNPLMNFPNAKGAVVQLSEYFSALKSQYVQDANECADKLHLIPTFAREVFSLYEQYNQKLKQKNLLEYQDQVNMMFSLIENSPEIFANQAYKHIMVDEYQDTDNLQFDLISALMDQENFESLMVVGDDSQSIFSFRFTSQENILNFHQFFDEVKDIYFVENFRSTPEIISTANLLNDLNKNKIDKNLISQAKHGEKPHLLSYRTLDDEYVGIASILEEQMKNGFRPESMAVIARTKSELLKIQQYLTDKGIASVMAIAEPLLNNRNVQIMISLTELFEDETMAYSLFEYLYIVHREQMEHLDVDQIRKFVEDSKAKLLAEFQLLSEESEKIDFYYRTVAEIGKQDFAVAGFLAELQTREFETLSELFSYLRKLVLYQDEKTGQKKDVQYQAVVLTTAHSSKGKEFDVVVNTIDNYKYEESVMKPEQIEEERRLLFVSITRAKKVLYITYQTNQDKVKTKGKYCKFVDELQGVEKVS